MDIAIIKIPDISNNMQFTLLQKINSNTSVIIVFKTQFRSDDVIVDIYKDNISETSKIIMGRKLTSDSLVCLPNREVNFSYYINCINQDGVKESLNVKNAYKFYLQFTSYDTGKLTE